MNIINESKNFDLKLIPILTTVVLDKNTQGFLFHTKEWRKKNWIEKGSKKHRQTIRVKK